MFDSQNLFLSLPSIGKHKVKISPVVLVSILDHHMRRQPALNYVVGTLLGYINEAGEIEVRNCFGILHKEQDDKVLLDLEYQKSMLDLHQKVNSKDFIIGWYSTSMDIASLLPFHEFYENEMKSQTRDITQPICVCVDTTLAQNQMNITVLSSSPVGPQKDQSVGSMFFPVPYEVHFTPSEKLGMDMIVRARNGSNTPVLSELDLLEQSVKQILEMIERVLNFVNGVIDGSNQATAELGRFLMDTISSVPKIDSAQFETIFSTQLHDMLMVVYLANLTRTQIAIAEKLSERILEKQKKQE